MRMRQLLWLLPALLHAAESYTISGIVIDADSGTPIGQARIEIQSQNQQGQQEVVPLAVLSGGDGTFRITNVPGGNYFLYSARNGYVAPDMPGKTSVQSVSLNGAAATIEAKFYLSKQAVVEGALHDDAGQAVTGASVNLLRITVEDGLRRYEIANGAASDSSGTFRIAGLQAGRYVLGINLMNGQQGEPGRVVLLPMFYPNTADPKQARIFVLTAGATEKAAMQVRPVPAYEIRGKVAASGRYPSLILRAKRAPGMPISREFNAVWNQQAQSFTFSGVPAGSYEVEASLQADARQLVAAQTVTVMGKDVDGILLNPEALKTLEGTIRYQASAVPRVGMVLLKSERNTMQAPVTADNKFRFANLRPDLYRLVLPVGIGQRLVSTQQEGRSVAAGGVLAAGGTLDVVVSNKMGTLTGTLPTEAPITVAVFHDDGKNLVLEAKQLFIGGKQFAMEAAASANLVVAWAEDAAAMENVEYAEEAVRAQLRKFGQKIALSEGTPTKIAIEQLLPATNR